MKMWLFAAVLLSGLVAGLMYCYSCSINPGLKSLPDKDYIRTMQSLNVAIENPVFFIAFMGLLLVLPVTSYQLYSQQQFIPFYLLLGATAIYFAGVFGVTICCNVPLNEALAKFPLVTATQSEISAMRDSFEVPWNRFHAVRTIAAIISFGQTIFCLIKIKS